MKTPHLDAAVSAKVSKLKSKLRTAKLRECIRYLSSSMCGCPYILTDLKNSGVKENPIDVLRGVLRLAELAQAEELRCAGFEAVGAEYVSLILNDPFLGFAVDGEDYPSVISAKLAEAKSK
jgi:hypothetical protein